jgi:hypothetical protein
MDIGNPGQCPDSCSVFVGDADKRADGVGYLAELVSDLAKLVGDLAELPIMGLDRLHQVLDPFVYRHVTLSSILPVSRASGRAACPSGKQQEPFQMLEQLNRTDGLDHIAVTGLAHRPKNVFGVA